MLPHLRGRAPVRGQGRAEVLTASRETTSAGCSAGFFGRCSVRVLHTPGEGTRLCRRWMCSVHVLRVPGEATGLCRRWTTHERLLAEGHRNVRREEELCVLGIGTEPSFAIGQRALLIQTGAPWGGGGGPPFAAGQPARHG